MKAAQQSKFPTQVLKSISQAKRYAEGTAVRIEVHEAKDLALVKKLVALKPVNGFAAEATAATILLVTGKLGMPVSTTHSITTAIMGVGCAKRFSALDWVIVERIIWAWLMTIPAAGLIAFVLVRLLGAMGVH